MNLESLHPYVSVLLLRATSAADAKQCAIDLISEIRGIITNKATVSNVIIGAQNKISRGLNVSLITYKESDNAPWITDSDFTNMTWHSIVVCRRKSLFAVCCSDSGLPRKLRGELCAVNNQIRQRLLMIPEDELNAAFVKGETQTLWLSGTHRRVTSKADSKVLSGIDLRAALDPLHDQSYFFSAARSRHTVQGVGLSVGVSPSRSSVWVGGSTSWREFTDKVTCIFQMIDGAGMPVHEPLPVLASIETSPQSATNPYDALIVPEDTFEPVNASNTSNGGESWSALRFENFATTMHGFSAQLTEVISGQRSSLGKVEISTLSGTKGKVDIKCKSSDVHTNPVRMTEIVAFINKYPDLLKVWYGSGHTIANSKIFKHHFRNLPFSEFVWEDFNGFNIDQEKPESLSPENIGNKKSLFCWVKTKWKPNGRQHLAGSGWLACNDGSMEIADFIHVNDGDEVPQITLVHVKSADSKSPNREVSVSAFEIIISQAVKNIRNLDTEIIAGNFDQRISKRIKDAVWKDGAKVNRAEMLQRLKAIDYNCKRRVVIVQPHLAKTLLAAARNQASSNNLRAKQLDTLLHTAQAACHAFGATFEVIGENF